MSLELKQIEELSLQHWPALESEYMDGWKLRMANGYTKRANCVSTLNYIANKSSQSMFANIASCEYKYSALKQPTFFKITPFSEPQLDELLEQLDYACVDPTLMLTLPLNELAAQAPIVKDVLKEDVSITFDEHISLRWLEEYCQLSGVNVTNIPTMIDMIAAMPGQVILARCSINEEVVALAMAIVDGETVGIYDVITAGAYRNLGLCSYLLHSLLKQCKQHGASLSYLAVVECNEPAKSVYFKLGYQVAYQYWYRVKE